MCKASEAEKRWGIDASRDLIIEQRAANDRLREIAVRMPRPGSIKPEAIRRGRLYNKDGSYRPALDDTAYDVTMKTAREAVLTRVFPAEGRNAVIVHFHGGGWTFGSVYEQDAMLTALATNVGAPCISIDYPLAPESSLPDTLDAAERALFALLDQHRGISVCVVGESAGAHVALQSVLRLRSHPELFGRLRSLSLAYGIYDLSMTASQRSWGNDFLGLSTDWLEWFYAMAVPGHTPDERADPTLSPLYADLAGLPPALLAIGSLDPLLDDSVLLAERLRAIGVDVTLRIYPEAPHGFNHQPTGMAALHNEAVAEFLKTHLDAARPENR